MRVSLEPVLRDCRAIYDLEGVMERYRAYVHLMTGQRGEFLPLGAFSPMGKRQAAYLDALIAQDAEGHAARVAAGVGSELETEPGLYRLALVVVDEPRNGWTQRFLTDADWRFKFVDALPKAAPAVGFERWVSVQLWTDLEPTRAYIAQETRAALYRAAYTKRHGFPGTLEAMMRQEGAALKFSGQHPWLEPEELEYTRAVLEDLRNCTHYPTNFAALYGDAAAKTVGYAPLGLADRAGFALALLESRSPRAALAAAMLGA